MCSNNSRRWNCSPQVSSVVIIRIELASYTSRKIGRWLSSKGSKNQAYERQSQCDMLYRPLKVTYNQND